MNRPLVRPEGRCGVIWPRPLGWAVTWEPSSTGRRGGQLKFSDLAIETALTLRLVFHLPLRQVEGFVRSLFARSPATC
jgi:hypothetical protein